MAPNVTARPYVADPRQHIYPLDLYLDPVECDEEGVEVWEGSLLRNGPSLHVRVERITATIDGDVEISWGCKLWIVTGEDMYVCAMDSSVYGLGDAYEKAAIKAYEVGRSWPQGHDYRLVDRAIMEREHEVEMQRRADRARHGAEEEMPI